MHRANFRFSDLQTLINQTRKELNKCHALKDILQDELAEALASPETPEEDKAEIVQGQASLKKLGKKAEALE